MGGVVAVSRSVPTGNHGLGYDPERFVQMIESRGLRILIDRYNHLVVLGRGGELVCMMFVSLQRVRGMAAGRDGHGRSPPDWRRADARGRRADRGGSQTGGGRRRELVMTIQVPFHLRRRSSTEPAVALLFTVARSARPGRFALASSSIPAAACSTSRRVFSSSLSGRLADPMPGAVRLRSVAPAPLRPG